MEHAIPGPAYRIVTRRTVIRCWNPEDAPLVKAAIDASLDHLRPWMAWAWEEPTDLLTKINTLRNFRGAFDLGQDFVYGIFNLYESCVLGGIGLSTRRGPDIREIGYWIHAEHINQGLATEVSAALTKVAFEIDGMHRVEIHCDPRNARSAAVPRKLGFVQEGTFRHVDPGHDGTYEDSLVWALLKEEYTGSPASKAEIEAYDVIGRRII